MNLINNSPDPNLTDEIESFDYKFKQLQHNRSDFTNSCSYIPYSNNGEESNTTNHLSNQLLKGEICSSELSNQFFSTCNINNIQDLLRQNVYILSEYKYRIGKQQVTELLIIMRHIYINNGRFQQNNIVEQINELNDIVIKKCVPFILTKLEQKEEYIHKINNSLPVMELPQNVNSSSTRTTLLGGSKQML